MTRISLKCRLMNGWLRREVGSFLLKPLSVSIYCVNICIKIGTKCHVLWLFFFVQDFGDYADSYYAVQTTEGEQIAQLISGYIDIILKKVQLWMLWDWHVRFAFSVVQGLSFGALMQLVGWQQWWVCGLWIVLAQQCPWLVHNDYVLVAALLLSQECCCLWARWPNSRWNYCIVWVIMTAWWQSGTLLTFSVNNGGGWASVL